MKKASPAIRRASLISVAVACLAAAPRVANAQLVADGATNIINSGLTNIAGPAVVGTNGSFTLLVITNGAVVTNSGKAFVGSNTTALNNRVIITGAGSSWGSGSNFTLGSFGSFNEVDVLGGGICTNQSAVLGSNASSGTNVVVVSGPGSLWRTTSIQFGFAGPGNQLWITNGGSVSCTGVTMALQNTSGRNVAIIEGSNSSLSVGAGMIIGFFGAGNYLCVSNGGTVNVSSFTVGGGVPLASNNVAVITGPGSSLSTVQLFVVGSYNYLVVSNGGQLTGRATFAQPGIGELIVVTDPGSRWSSDTSFVIGQVNGSRNNQVIVSNGAIAATQGGVIGTGMANENIVTVTGPGSVWTNSSDVYVGQGGSSNQVIILNGGHVEGSTCYVGDAAATPGNSVTVAGSGSLWTNSGDFHVGELSPNSSLIITNGGTVLNGIGVVGNDPGATGNLVVVSDSGSLWSNRLDLFFGSNSLANQLIVSNGSVLAARNLYLSYAGQPSNYVTIDGGTIILGNGGAGLLAAQNGTVTLNSGMVKTDILTAASNSFVFNGGTLLSRSATCTGSSPFVVGNGNNAATFQSAPGGSHSFAPGGIVVSSNAVLAGYGQIAGNLTLQTGALLSPGSNDITTLTNNGNLVIADGATVAMDLNPASAAADRITAISSITYGGVLQLNRVAGSYSNGNTFTLFGAATYGGSFGSLVPASPGPGLRWDANKMTVDGTLRVFSVPTPRPLLSVPAPAGGNFVINATGGIPYDPCRLVTSTNLLVPLKDWSPVATNHFGPAGTTSFTNAITAGEPARYFTVGVD